MASANHYAAIAIAVQGVQALPWQRMPQQAEGVGLSKRGVQDALGHLGKRRLIAVERESITAVPVYTVLRPWRR